MSKEIKKEGMFFEITNALQTKVSDEFLAEIVEVVIESEYTFGFKSTTKPIGIYQEEDELENIKGIWVNQTTNGGYTGDEFAGTVSVKITDIEYLQFSYSM